MVKAGYPKHEENNPCNFLERLKSYMDFPRVFGMQPHKALPYQWSYHDDRLSCPTFHRTSSMLDMFMTVQRFDVTKGW